MAGSSNHEVRVICGPTASGKSAIALWLADHFNIAIVSADSRQLYTGFDIGTAKSTLEQRQRVKHFGIDVLEPVERASAAWWATNADQWIDIASGEGYTPIVVGGTGLYLKALFGSLFQEPALDADYRNAIQAWAGVMSLSDLRRFAFALDPLRAHLGRTQLIRSIEIAFITGRRLSALHVELSRPPLRVGRYLLVDPGERLATDIETRTRRMLISGWPEEVERLNLEIAEDAPAWNAAGYQTIRDMVGGRIARSEAERRVVIETRQYAKRQRTWFRHQLAGCEVTKVSTEEPKWRERVLAWWANDGVRQ